MYKVTERDIQTIRSIYIYFLCFKELGGNVDTKVLREWFKSVDFDNDGFVDFFDWVRLLEHPEAVDLSAYFRVQFFVLFT